MPVYPLNLTYEEFQENNGSLTRMKISKYLIGEQIGKGGFGKVYRGLNLEDKKQVAVKLIDLKAIDDAEKSQKIKEIMRRLARTESDMMATIQSPHVMKLYDVFENQCLKIMVVEYCNDGSLSNYIYKNQKICEEEAIEILKQLITGLSAMHERSIVHRDIKSDNIMCHNGVYKIIDLGFAKMLPSNSQIYKGTVLGTSITMAPEVMHRQPYGVKADIWSLGIILYEMVYGILPFEVMKTMDMYRQIISKDIFPNDGKVNGYRASPRMIALIKELLVIDQEKRLSWRQLLDHPIFKTNQSLNPTIIVRVSLEGLVYFESKERNEITRLGELNQLKPFASDLRVKPSRVSNKQLDSYFNQIQTTDRQMMKHVRQFYLECLKTEYILKNIINPFESEKHPNIDQRREVQLLYLLSSRCYCNMSNVKFHISYEKNEVVELTIKNVNFLYKMVSEKFMFYATKLKIIEDRISSIIIDGLHKIFTKKQIQKKDQFLVGVEINQDSSKHIGDYAKQEQIAYTYEQYIKPILKEEKFDQKLQLSMINYRKINGITSKDIKKANFYEIVEKITQSQ